MKSQTITQHSKQTLPVTCPCSIHKTIQIQKYIEHTIHLLLEQIIKGQINVNRYIGFEVKFPNGPFLLVGLYPNTDSLTWGKSLACI